MSPSPNILTFGQDHNFYQIMIEDVKQMSGGEQRSVRKRIIRKEREKEQEAGEQEKSFGGKKGHRPYVVL